MMSPSIFEPVLGFRETLGSASVSNHLMVCMFLLLFQWIK
jgi:hypothetical protein